MRRLADRLGEIVKEPFKLEGETLTIEGCSFIIYPYTREEARHHRAVLRGAPEVCLIDVTGDLAHLQASDIEKAWLACRDKALFARAAMGRGVPKAAGNVPGYDVHNRSLCIAGLDAEKLAKLLDAITKVDPELLP